MAAFSIVEPTAVLAVFAEGVERYALRAVVHAVPTLLFIAEFATFSIWTIVIGVTARAVPTARRDQFGKTSLVLTEVRLKLDTGFPGPLSDAVDSISVIEMVRT